MDAPEQLHEAQARVRLAVGALRHHRIQQLATQEQLQYEVHLRGARGTQFFVNALAEEPGLGFQVRPYIELPKSSSSVGLPEVYLQGAHTPLTLEHGCPAGRESAPGSAHNRSRRVDGGVRKTAGLQLPVTFQQPM